VAGILLFSKSDCGNESQQWLTAHLIALVILLYCPFELSATLIPVKHKEGVSHGFIVLHSQDGRRLAAGDMIQTVEGERVTSEVVLHFGDGSTHEEVTVFSQDREFRLIHEHLRQHGPSFPHPVDVSIDVPSGTVKLRSAKNGSSKTEEQHLKMPEDVATGMTLTLLKNLEPSAAETTVSMVTTGTKPHVVKVKIRSQGERRFWSAAQAHNAIHYVIHVDIPGIKGAVAPIVGKQPPDTHVWVLGGTAPAFVKFEGPLYEQGPVWVVDLAPLRWDPDNAKQRK
jgi:hypothetical protein